MSQKRKKALTEKQQESLYRDGTNFEKHNESYKKVYTMLLVFAEGSLKEAGKDVSDLSQRELDIIIAYLGGAINFASHYLKLVEKRQSAFVLSFLVEVLFSGDYKKMSKADHLLDQAVADKELLTLAQTGAKTVSLFSRKGSDKTELLSVLRQEFEKLETP